jgi:hypothetical protein
MPVRGIILTYGLIAALLLTHVQAVLADPLSKQPEKKAKPGPNFTISKETTYVTEPLDKDGRIDYEKALNTRLRKGATKDNNANVLIWRALGPTPEGGQGMPEEFFKLQGVEAPPEKGDYFISLGKFIDTNLKGDQLKRDDLIERQHRIVLNNSWKGDEHPEFAVWLEFNKRPLAVVAEATKRTHYFSPMVPRRNEKGESPGLIGSLLPGVQKCRELGTSLIMRAMLRLSEGKVEAAWEDLITAHRLGRHVGSGACLIEALVGYALEALASRGELVFLEHAKLTPKQLEKCVRDLEALPPLPLVSEKLDLCERFVFLDCVMMIDRRGMDYLIVLDAAGPKEADPVPGGMMKLINWDPALRSANENYDRMVKIAREPDRAKRNLQWQEWVGDLKKLKGEAIDYGKILQNVGKGEDPGKVLGKAVGNVLIAMLLPATEKVQVAEDRSTQIHRNLHVAFALARYKADNSGRYPKELSELAPKYLKQVPLDLFSGKALIYRPAEKGYLFYSVGPNGKDDDGKGRDDDPAGDDLPVRMPTMK